MQCRNCNLELIGREKRNNVYCNSKCQHEYQANKLIDCWLETGTFTVPAKGWILKDQDYKCAICRDTDIWNGKPIVFILDHIDGNSENNWRSNLRCICPNCDSQLPTFKGRNKGKGRHTRRERYKQGLSY